MDLREFTTREHIKDFFEGVAAQMPARQYTEETFDRAVETLYRLFAKAEDMDKDESDAYLTTCLGVYILASYEKNDDIITDISPK